MIYKTIKALVVALTLVAGNSVFAASGGEPAPMYCCGVLQPAGSKGCSGMCINQPITRARGDVVTFNLTNKTPTQLQTSGTLAVPQVGGLDLYQFEFKPMSQAAIAKYGKIAAKDKVIKVLIASYDLVDASKNQNPSSAMKTIISKALIKNPNAKTMIWVGRALPGETTYTEITETLSPIADLSKLKQISYKTDASGAVEVTLPDSQDAQGHTVKGEVFTIDFAPINKQ